MMAVGLTLMPALLVAFGRRAFWPAGPGDRAGGARGRAGLAARQRPGAPSSAAAGDRLRRVLLSLGALGNLEGRDYLDLSQQYRNAPESVQGQELVRKRFPPGRVAPLDLVTSAPASIGVRDELRKTKGIADANTDAQSSDGRLVSTEVLLAVDPFARSSMDMIPRIREIARKAGQGQTVLLGGRHRREPRQPAGAAPRREADRAAGADPDPDRADRSAALRDRAAVPDRHGDPLVRVRARDLVADLHPRLRPAGLGPEPGDLLLHLPGRARGRRQHLPDDPDPRGAPPRRGHARGRDRRAWSGPAG